MQIGDLVGRRIRFQEDVVLLNRGTTPLLLGVSKWSSNILTEEAVERLKRNRPSRRHPRPASARSIM